MVNDPRHVCMECYADTKWMMLQDRLDDKEVVGDLWIWVICFVCPRCGWMTVEEFYTSKEFSEGVGT